MSTGWIVLIVVLVILIGVLVGLYFFGKKAEKKQAAQQEQMDAMAQTVNMLIIDKKKMKLKEANLPSAVLENTPKYLRRTKVPVVKAKVGPRVMTLMCDAKIFDLIPIKKEVKATVSGIYITAVKGVRGPLEAPEKAKKKGFFASCAVRPARHCPCYLCSSRNRRGSRSALTRRCTCHPPRYRCAESVLWLYRVLLRCGSPPRTSRSPSHTGWRWC